VPLALVAGIVARLGYPLIEGVSDLLAGFGRRVLVDHRCRTLLWPLSVTAYNMAGRTPPPGLVFTYVWAFNVPGDQAVVEEFAKPFRERGARVLFVELEAAQDERLKRTAGVWRLAEKPSRRDLDAARRDLLDDDARYQLNSGGKFDDRRDYLRINNTLLTPGKVAERVIEHFALPRFTGANPT
jgi:hypothetical protein